MTPNTGRFEMLRSLAAKFRPHCVSELLWQEFFETNDTNLGSEAMLNLLMFWPS